MSGSNGSGAFLAEDANPTVSVQISSGNLKNVEQTFLKKESTLSIKKELELLTSVDRKSMAVKMYDANDKLVCELDDDMKQLGLYDIEDGMRLHVEDVQLLKKNDESDFENSAESDERNLKKSAESVSKDESSVESTEGTVERNDTEHEQDVDSNEPAVGFTNAVRSLQDIAEHSKLRPTAKEFIPIAQQIADHDTSKVDGEIMQTLEYMVQELVEEPGSYNRIMNELSNKIKQWGVNETMVQQILRYLVESTVALGHFSYLGAKICCQLVRFVSDIAPKIPVRHLLLTICEDTYNSIEFWLKIELTRGNAYRFIYFLSELYDQLLIRNARVKCLFEALCRAYVLLLEEPHIVSNIQCVSTALKLTGRNLYQDNRLMLQQIVSKLEELFQSSFLDSITMANLSNVIELSKCGWGLVESHTTSVEDNDKCLESVETSWAAPVGSVTSWAAQSQRWDFVGPDGELLTNEQKEFLSDNGIHCEGRPETEDSGMTDEMMTAYEEFLLTIPAEQNKF